MHEAPTGLLRRWIAWTSLMRRVLVGFAILAMTSFAASPARAGLIEITLVPSVDTISQGQNLFVDINLAGLQSSDVDNLLGAWSMDVIYDSALLSPLLIPPAGFGNRLGSVAGGEALGGADTAAPGTMSLFLVSLLPDFQLDALQRDANGVLLDGFTLATLGFFAQSDTPFNAPTTTIGTTNIVLGDAFGNPLSDANGVPLPIQHLPVTLRVPEPGTLALLVIAVMGMLLVHRERAPNRRRSSA